MLYKANKTDH